MPNGGREAFTLQTLATVPKTPSGEQRLANHSGFSLHVGVTAAAHQRDKVAFYGHCGLHYTCMVRPKLMLLES